MKLYYDFTFGQKLKVKNVSPTRKLVMPKSMLLYSYN